MSSSSQLIPAPAEDRAAVTSLFTVHTDFKEGVAFVDIFPLFASPSATRVLVRHMEAVLRDRAAFPEGVDAVIGLESRGFLLGVLLAEHLGVGFVPVRKAGKLPGECETLDYALEYGKQSFQMQRNHGFAPGARAVIADDLLATGGG